MAAPAWRVLTASRVGAQHIAAGAAGEDAVSVWPPDGQGHDEPAVAVAVADGHGHVRHFRSGRGARLAVEVAAAVGAELAAAITALPGEAEVEAALRAAAGQDLVRRWRDAVERDLAASPVTDVERDLAGLAPDPSIDNLVYAYGTTLVLAVAVADWLLFAQIGDGDAIVITDAGAVLRPLPPDPRLDGVVTTSLCQPNAAAAMRYGVVNRAGQSVGAVLLATDGFGNAQAREDWETAFAADLAALAARHSRLWFETQLPRWVAQCASNDGSGDDVTVALMFAVETTWPPPPSAPTVLPAPAVSSVDFGRTVPILPPASAVGLDDVTLPVGPETGGAR
jgi:hypothetical protein